MPSVSNPSVARRVGHRGQRRRREKLKNKPADASKPAPAPPPHQEAQPKAAATAKDAKAMERLQARLAMAEAMLKTAHRSFSEKATEAAKLRKEVEALTKDGPQWARNQLAILRQDNAALRREIDELTALAKLPADQHKRYLESCRRWRAKKQAELNAEWRSIKERERTVGERTGAIPAALWRDLLLCLHPDRSASDKVLARTFDEMRKREGVLRAR
jgi:hypothetical protein